MNWSNLYHMTFQIYKAEMTYSWMWKNLLWTLIIWERFSFSILLLAQKITAYKIGQLFFNVNMFSLTKSYCVLLNPACIFTHTISIQVCFQMTLDWAFTYPWKICKYSENEEILEKSDKWVYINTLPACT